MMYPDLNTIKSLLKIKNIIYQRFYIICKNTNTMQRKPKYKNVLLDIYDFFEESINKEIKDDKIILDPELDLVKL